MGKKKKGKQPKKKGGGGYADLAEDGGSAKGGRAAAPVGKQRKKKKPKGGKPGTQMFDDDAFRKTLLADGKKSISEMSSDGNCLFRSLSDQLYGDYGSRHDQVRKEVCDFLEENEEDFAVFLLMEDDDEEDVADFDDYIGKMREDGEWGGNVELVSAARLYERTITVFSPTGAFSIESGHEKVSGDNLLLSYHDNGHYNSVRDENTKIQPPPIKSRGQTKKKKAKAGGAVDKEEEKKVDTEQIDIGEGLAEKKTPKGDVKSCEDGSTGGGGKQKPLRRNDACPCGSGLRYKKCCLAVEKSQARAAKWKEKHGLVDGETSATPNEEQTEVIEGDFRVMKI